MKTNCSIAGPESVRDPLEILFVGTLPPHQGGSALSAAMLLPRLAAMGWGVRSLAVTPPDVTAAARDFDAQFPQVHVQRIPVARMIINPGRPSAAEWVADDEPIVAEAFRQAVAAARPDVVLLGRETVVTSVDAELARSRLPGVLRVTGAYARAALEGVFAAHHSEDLISALSRLKNVVVQAPHFGDLLQSHSFQNVSMIPNGVDLEIFSPGPADQPTLRRWAVGPNNFVALHISNMKDGKRPLDIVHSMIEVLDAEPNVVYVFVGEGPLLPEVRREVSARGLDYAVRFEPWGAPADVVRYLRSASAVIMPSEYEHQSRVSMETQSCGRLLIASDIAGARELVTDGETGLLFKLGDCRDLAAKTLHAVRHPEILERIGRQARQSIRSHDADEVAQQYADLLRRVAVERNGSRR